MARLYIRVTKDDQNNFKHELMQNGEKIADVSYVDIVEMVMQFTSSLRFLAVK